MTADPADKDTRVVTPSGKVPKVDPKELDEVMPIDLDEQLVEVSPAADDAAGDPAPTTGPPPDTPFQPPTKRAFGRFELLIEMGRGGMATLFLARIQGPQNFQKLLAIKKIHDHLAVEEQFVNMFLDEARIAALIHHANVATIFDMGRIEKSYFIAMEYIHGQSVVDVLKAGVRNPGKFPWSHAVRLISDAAIGLHAAHELKSATGKPMGVVHRDVSPQNILLSYDGDVKVVDFGIAYAAEKLEHTEAGTLKGKAGYMSPEQAMGEDLDRRSDIFSLAIVLWELLCGRRLFKEKTEGATILKVRDAIVPSPKIYNSDVPVAIQDVVLKALSRDREKRYATAEDFAGELDTVLVSEGVVVNRQKLAQVTRDIFYDRKKIKDQQIQQALKDSDSPTIKGVGMGGTATDSLELMAPSTQPARRSPVTLIASIGALIAAFGAVIVVVLNPFGSGSSKSTGSQKTVVKVVEKERPRPPEMTQAPAMKPKANVTLQVTVEPALPDAEVTFRGKTYKTTLFRMVVKRSVATEMIQIRAPGYATDTLIVVPNADFKVTVKLRKAPKKKKPMYRWRPMRRKRPMSDLRDIDW